MLASPSCFFVFITGHAPPVLLSMAAFLRLPIRGCLTKSRATHSPRDVVIPGLFLFCGTEVAPRLSGAGTRNMTLPTVSPATPAAVWPSAVCHYMAEAKAAEAPIYLLFPAHPTGYPPTREKKVDLVRSGQVKFPDLTRSWFCRDLTASTSDLTRSTLNMTISTLDLIRSGQISTKRRSG